MSRTIAIAKNAKLNELTGRHLQVASKIKGTLEVAQLRKQCRTMKPKRFRAVVRELVAARVVTVKRVK